MVPFRHTLCVIHPQLASCITLRSSQLPASSILPSPDQLLNDTATVLQCQQASHVLSNYNHPSLFFTSFTLSSSEIFFMFDLILNIRYMSYNKYIWLSLNYKITCRWDGPQTIIVIQGCRCHHGPLSIVIWAHLTTTMPHPLVTHNHAFTCCSNTRYEYNLYHMCSFHI